MNWKIALIIVALLAVIILLVRMEPLKHRRAKEHLTKAAGGYNEHTKDARTALESIKKRDIGEERELLKIKRLDLLNDETLPDPLAEAETVAYDYIHLIDMVNPAHEQRGAILNDIRNYLLDDEIMPGIAYEPLMETYNTHETDFRVNRAGAIRKKAVATSDTAIDATNKYYENSRAWSSNTQSVHDSIAVRSLRDTYEHMATTDVRDTAATKASVVAWVAKNKPHLSETVNKVLNFISDGNSVSSYGGKSDADVLAQVWARTKHPNNAQNTENMRDAVVLALADSVENGTVVCVNGRCNKLIESLSGIDFEIEPSRTVEVLKNQAFEESGKIVRELLDSLANGDGALKNAAIAYKTGDDNLAAKEETDALRAELVAAINKNLDKYKKDISDGILNVWRIECEAGVI
jgi:hypothetical protein